MKVKDYPYKLKLPKKAKSPTNSIYKLFDIESQRNALQTFSKDSHTLYSLKPFVVRFTTTGKNLVILGSARVTSKI